jgi:small-conductance mechanosensitive channel
MDKEQSTKVEELKQDADVRRALDQTSSATPAALPKAPPKEKVWVATYIVILLAVGAAYYILGFWTPDPIAVYVPIIRRVLVGALAIVGVLMVLKIIKTYLVQAVTSSAARYNLNRVLNLLAGLGIVFIVLSLLFANWYTAVVSFGLISLILGFALQTPITSFIGWIYLMVKTPYRVGDRIRIGDATCDVIDVSYLDTTLWEFGGQLLSTTHHPSGRIIKFPNSKVLNSSVYNYSWSLFPYIWNDIKLQIAYQSDLKFVAHVMQTAAEEEVGEAMMERVEVYRELLSQTPVDALEVQERPVVVFRVGENTWIEAIVRYLVEPRRAGTVKTRLIKKILDRLNAEPEKVMFPRGDLR